LSAAPAIAVVTPVHDGALRYLPDAYASLLEQDDGWRWFVQLDGAGLDVPESLHADPRVHVDSNGRRLGTATTRNRALIGSTGELVFALDADDRLLPGALRTLAEGLGATEAAFAFGRSLSWFEDGRRELFRPVGLDPGLLAPGTLEALWRVRSGVPLHGASLLWRREHLLAHGGWAALAHSSEDFAVVLAAQLRAPALYVDADVVLYRRHEAQTIAAAHYHEHRPRNWRFVHERLLALRRLAGEPVPEGYDVAPVPTDP
jgi:glycosyltransferase involved in cell wall biosynthesis